MKRTTKNNISAFRPAQILTSALMLGLLAGMNGLAIEQTSESEPVDSAVATATPSSNSVKDYSTKVKGMMATKLGSLLNNALGQLDHQLDALTNVAKAKAPARKADRANGREQALPDSSQTGSETPTEVASAGATANDGEAEPETAGTTTPTSPTEGSEVVPGDEVTPSQDTPPAAPGATERPPAKRENRMPPRREPRPPVAPDQNPGRPNAGGEPAHRPNIIPLPKAGPPHRPPPVGRPSTNPTPVRSNGQRGEPAGNLKQIEAVRQAMHKRAGQPGYNAAADLNQDGVVNERDLALASRQTTLPRQSQPRQRGVE